MDEATIRSWFPGTRHRAYFNAAAASLLPVQVKEAIDSVTAGWIEKGILCWASDMARVEETREAAADLVGCAPREIALVSNTAEGISRVAAGIDWKEGDEVVLGDLEYPANVYPWAAQQRRGARLRWVRSDEGRLDAGRLIDAIGSRTRVLAVSMVQFGSGYRVDLDALGEACRSSGVLLVVDAIQGLGVFPLDVKKIGIGALATDGRKWLMGPAGAGFLFVDEERIPEIRPVSAGALSVRNPNDFLQYVDRTDGQGRIGLDAMLREGAGRYEPGYPNVCGMAGLGAALTVGAEIGRDVIHGRVTSLVGRLVDALAARGWPVYGPAVKEERSGIVSFSVDADADRISGELDRSGYSLAVRDGRLRVSPHVYNTEGEIDGLLARLDELTGR